MRDSKGATVGIHSVCTETAAVQDQHASEPIGDVIVVRSVSSHADAGSDLTDFSESMQALAGVRD